MKILSITAQKPNSTGSGVYLTELVKEFSSQGHEQAVVAGIYKEDMVEFPEGVTCYPVYFRTPKLPFAIAGMSDEMPYESTIYGSMTPSMTEQFKKAFREMIQKAASEFKPDLVLCHHLYLVTALVRELLPECKVYGFCHNTDLRQMKKTPLERDYIREQIQKLDAVFAIHKEQMEEIIHTYDMPAGRIQIIGTGYNSGIFYPEARPEHNRPEHKKGVTLIFAGKLSEKKGVMSLLRSLRYLQSNPEEICLKLAGGYGNQDEYEKIKRLAEAAPYPVEFLGRLPQEALAKAYNQSDIFVLPSFYEGLPLTVIEALACGDKVVVTDLPGIRPWLFENVPGAPVCYVTPPRMRHTDEAEPEALEAFERELAEKIEESIQMDVCGTLDLTQISWGNICEKILLAT